MKNLILFIFIILNLFSCLKDFPPEPLQRKYTRILKRGKWLVERYYLNGKISNNSFPTCQYDDYLFFKESGKFFVLDDRMKCGTSDTSDIGTWIVSDSILYLNTNKISNARFRCKILDERRLAIISMDSILSFKSIFRIDMLNITK